MRKNDSKGRYPIIPKRAITKSVVHCPDCGEPFIIYRGIKKTRSYQGGHVKDLWCYKCEGVKKFVQARHDVAKYHF